jgi:hypothetical protein
MLPPADVTFTVTPAANVVTFHATAQQLTVYWGDGASDDYIAVDLHQHAITHCARDRGRIDGVWR